ncbi:hypothetical protein D4764_13G0000290 [Takifugu flavidus]|uniref:Uncharacterized protein n=1 Tax=Takifugu flavidus TaxID=433684 RepID=A0A5C6PB37_9TELE|nr:hypothetical protein D4764_13G0000290 [Takifugu flavidus]
MDPVSFSTCQDIKTRPPPSKGPQVDKGWAEQFPASPLWGEQGTPEDDLLSLSTPAVLSTHRLLDACSRCSACSSLTLFVSHMHPLAQNLDLSKLVFNLTLSCVSADPTKVGMPHFPSSLLSLCPSNFPLSLPLLHSTCQPLPPHQLNSTHLQAQLELIPNQPCL